VNFINATIAPVRELVIVIADLYLPRGEDADRVRAGVTAGSAPGFEFAARFGERAALADGWRAWLARRLGRGDLANLAPARIAAAMCADAPEGVGGMAATAWIATPVQLVAGLTRVHLAAHGILRLPPAELASLAGSFRRVFGGSGLALYPLPCGELLLFTAGMPALATLEPARAVGAELAQSLPQGPQAAPLRRLGAEIEMWLHGEAVNAARAQRGEPPVTSLWLWGSADTPDTPLHAAGAAVAAPRTARAFGTDAWLEGLSRIQGSAYEALPARLRLGEEPANLEVWVLEVRQELVAAGGGASLAHALAQLDLRFMSPALAALKAGLADSVTLMANDTRVTLTPRSGRKFWRRARPGGGGLL
jgi:hypothetical protein